MGVDVNYIEELNKDKFTNHDIHHYTVIYILILLIISYVILYVIRKIKSNVKQSNKFEEIIIEDKIEKD